MTSRSSAVRSDSPRSYMLRLAAVLVVLMLAIGLLGWYFLRVSRDRIREDAANELQAISDLKTASITEWREERLADARIISEDALLADDIAAWLADPRVPDLERKLRRWMESIKIHYQCGAVILHDAGAAVRLETGSPDLHFQDADRHAVRQCLAERETIISDLYAHAESQKIHQDIYIPIRGAAAGPPLAVIQLVIDPDQFLFPNLRFWPTSSRTAESLLVRRDGNQLLYLNELRHQQGSALKKRLPIDLPLLPAAMAVRGVTGAVDGEDYRGRPVLAYLQPVPDSGWFLVCKADRDEVYQPYLRLAWRAGLVMLALVLFSAFWVRSLWKHRQVRWELDQQETLRQLNASLEKKVEEQTSAIQQSFEAAERERRKLYEVLETLPAYVALLSSDYHVPFANRVFRERFGEPRDRRCYEFLFNRTEPCETCETYTVLKSGKPHHWEWTGPDAREYDVHDFLFTDTDGSPLILEMGLDITDRKRAEAELREINETLEQRVAERTAEVRESEARLKLAQVSAGAGIWDWDISSGRIEWSPELFSLYGLDPGTSPTGFDAWKGVLHPDDRTTAEAQLEAAVRGGTPLDSEYRIRLASGSERWIKTLGKTLLDEGGHPLRMTGICLDITARKQAELRLERELEAMKRLHQISALSLREISLESVLTQIVDAAIAITGADFGNIQLLEPSTGDLRIVAHRGFPAWWLDYWNSVTRGKGVCGTALERGERVVVEDVEQSPIFAGSPALEIQRRAGVRAVQSTPLAGRTGTILGMFSTHFRSPHKPDPRAMSLLDLLARQAADILDRHQAEEELRRLNADLDRAEAVGQIGYWRLDTRRNILTWSDENHRIFGVPKGTPLTYQTFLAIVHPEDRDRVDAAWQSGLRGEPYDIEHRLLVDSAVKWVREKAYLEFDASGALVGGFGITQDITARRLAEEESRTSGERLRWALKAGGGGAWDWDLVNGTAWWSPEMYALWGIEPGSIMRLENSLRPILEADRPSVQRAVEEALDRRTDYQCEFRIHHPQAGERWIRSIGRGQYDDAGQAVRLIGISLDITDRRSAEEALRASEERFRIALQGSPITVATLDQDLRYTWIYNTRHGFDPQEVVGRRPDELIEPQDAVEIMEFLRRVLNTGVPEHGTVSGRTRGERWVYDISAEPVREERGRPARLMIALVDITERARMEQDLLELERFKLRERSQKEWQTTFDFITDPISIHDRNGRLIKANRAFMAYFGLAPDGMENPFCHTLFSRLGIAAANCPMLQTLRSGAPETREISDPAQGRILEISTFPHEAPDGSREGCIHVIKDITSRKENEMQLIMNERLAALGQMAAGIAHEINNPLATISGCAEGLSNRTRKGQFDPALFADYLRIIDEEIVRCKAITSSMLSFVRRGNPQRQVHNAREVLDRTLELIGFQGRLRNVELLKDFASWVEPVLAAETELKQVFVALLSNALDAMNDKGTLAVAMGGDGGTVRISIRDSGPGVPPHLADRIFDPFFTTKQGAGGTGLGLPIARRIVESMGGSLELSASPGGGAFFTVTLPRAEFDAPIEPHREA